MSFYEDYTLVGIAIDSSGSVFVADTLANRVRKISHGVITTAAGSGAASLPGGYGGDNGPATRAQLSQPHGIAVDSSGNLYIADCANNVIRKVSNGIITTVAGGGNAYPGDNGPATSASLSEPLGVALDSTGNLYFSEWGHNRVRMISGGVITTVAGNGTSVSSGDAGPATSAGLLGPDGVAVDSAGNLYIAELGGGRVRKVSNGIISTVAGGGTAYPDDGQAATSVRLLPAAVSVDSSGNLYVADGYNFIQRISGGVIDTVAGNSLIGFSGDNGPATSASLGFPGGVAVDSSGNIYVADNYNNRVRVLTPSAGVSPASGSGWTQTFTFSFTDGHGWQSLTVVDVLIGGALDSRAACYVAFVPSGANSGSVYLVDDRGDAGGPYPGLVLPGGGAVSNSQCIVSGAGSSVSGNANTLTLTLAITFLPSFAGNKVIYLSSRDTWSAVSGWQALATWNVPGAVVPSGPWVTGMSPARSMGAGQSYWFFFTDTNGWQDISVADVLVNGAINGIGACYVAFVPSGAGSGALLLVDDAGDPGGPYSGMLLPSSETVSNSQCTISGAGSSVTATGNRLTLTLDISFSQNLAGSQVFYLAARSNTLTSGWQAVGSVTIP